MIRRLPDYAKPLGLLIGAYVIVFFSLAYRRFTVFGWDTADFATFDQMLWWTLQGRPFYVGTMGISMLGWHTAFLWVQLLPLYWVFPGIPLLIFMQTLFLGMCAVPMYLIVRRILGDHKSALVLAAAFLLLPPVRSQNVNQVEEPSFVAVYLLFAFYFFQTERFGLFMLFAGIACLDRENVPLTVGMFGIYAAILRRDKKWVIAPLGLGILYFWLAMFVIMPYFRQGHQWHVMRMFSYLGDTPATIMKTALTDPARVLTHLLGQENVTYFILLVQPLAWVLPFLSLASLMAMPDLAINLLSDNGAMKVIPWHYNVVTGCFLFVSAAHGLKKFAGWLRRRYGKQAPELPLAICLLLLVVAHWHVWFVPNQYRKLPQHDSLVHALHAIPPDKSVLVPTRIQGHVGKRERWASLPTILEKPGFAAQFEYVIIDANERQFPPLITQEFFDKFYKDSKYHLIFAENNVFVFQRSGGESDWRIGPLEQPPATK